MSSEKTYGEFAWKSPGDELKAARSHALKATVCCIAMFVLVCSMAANVWQVNQNMKAIEQENDKTRQLLKYEQHQRRTLEATMAAKEGKP